MPIENSQEILNGVRSVNSKGKKSAEIKPLDPRHVAVAQLMEKGVSIRKAMMQGGYSRARAHRGVEAVPKGVMALLAKRGKAYQRLAREYDPDHRAELVRGALVQNVLERQDKATKSLELLGRDVAVGIFKSDASAVNVQINLPAGLADLFTELNAGTPKQLEGSNNNE
jgi:hypothetical protein